MRKIKRSLESSFIGRVELRVGVICHFSGNKLWPDLLVIISILILDNFLNFSSSHVIFLQPWFVCLLNSFNSIRAWLGHFSSWFISFGFIHMIDCMKIRRRLKKLSFYSIWSLPGFIFKSSSCFLMLTKLISGSISKIDEFSNANLFCFLSILLFELFDEGCFGKLIVFVIGVVELVHASGCSMGIVPDELLGFVELFGFGDLGLRWEGVREDRFQPVFFYCWFAQLTHNKIMERLYLTGNLYWLIVNYFQ